MAAMLLVPGLLGERRCCEARGSGRDETATAQAGHGAVPLARRVRQTLRQASERAVAGLRQSLFRILHTLLWSAA